MTIEIHHGSTNVYADIGLGDAGEMLVKAQLIVQLGQAIQSRKFSLEQAADVIGVPVSELSQIMRGRFRSYKIQHIACWLDQARGSRPLSVT